MKMVAKPAFRHPVMKFVANCKLR